MLDFANNASNALPVVSFINPASSSLDVSCLNSHVIAHPMFASGYQCGYALYFDVESADPGDIVYGAPVTRIAVIESICRSTLGTDYHGASDLFFWSVGTCAGFLYHGKEAQAGLEVLTSLSGVILSEVLGC